MKKNSDKSIFAYNLLRAGSCNHYFLDEDCYYHDQRHGYRDPGRIYLFTNIDFKAISIWDNSP